MKRRMIATDAKLFALLDEIEKGVEIEITRCGITVARLGRACGPHALRRRFAGVARTASREEELFGIRLA